MKEYLPVSYSEHFKRRKPVLVLGDGETLKTYTVDCFGCDASGKRLHTGSNPLTGPFAIEGAKPGDTLAVNIIALRPTRNTGSSYDTLVPDATRGKTRKFKKVSWAIDNAKKTISRGRFKFKFNPMLGCFGVAAKGKPITSVTSAACGGNMDYNGFGEGVTAYFPVFHDGALFYVADGHALQGDGELLCTGIETSFQVTLQFEVLKKKRINTPRGQSKSEIFTVGSGRPLDEALKLATDEMKLWLVKDYGLKPSEAELFLGMKAKYRIGNICDPAYTVICRALKDDLRSVISK